MIFQDNTVLAQV